MTNNVEKITHYDEQVPVLIVGGSLVGLASSVLLSAQGIASLLVERHPGTSIHPRVATLSARSMEILRSAGVEPAIRRVEPPFAKDDVVPIVESLVGEELGRIQEDMGAAFTEASPVSGSLIAQDVLEPALRQHAKQMGADLRYGTELVAFEQDEEGVTATIRELASGTTRTVRADYLVAADGSQSAIRERLGIGRHGDGTLFHILSIIFRADIMEFFQKRHAVMCLVGNELIPTAFLVPYPGSAARPDLYRLDMPYDPDEESIESYPPERCLELVRAAIGKADIPVDLKTVLTYDLAALVADRWAQGRVFLVGDAARVQPPSGALGGNTGIAEAQNLAWKLAACLRGEAGPGLLATYDEERRSIANLTVEQVTLLSQQRNIGPEAITVDPLVVNMGYRYASGAFVPEHDVDLPLLQHPLRWQGQPGTRAPHLPLEREGQRISTIDLFGRGWVVLAGSRGQLWKEAARQAAAQCNVPVQVYQMGSDLIDVSGSFCAPYGVMETGAVLVRPDGFVAWRAKDATLEGEDPATFLAQTFARLLCR
jgi:putative polyketide hydroxylase